MRFSLEAVPAIKKRCCMKSKDLEIIDKTVRRERRENREILSQDSRTHDGYEDDMIPIKAQV